MHHQPRTIATYFLAVLAIPYAVFYIALLSPVQLFFFPPHPLGSPLHDDLKIFPSKLGDEDPEGPLIVNKLNFQIGVLFYCGYLSLFLG